MLMLSLVVLSSIGCNMANKKIEGHYTGLEGKLNMFYDGRATVDSYLGNDKTPPLMNDAVFVDFFRDGTYIMQFNHFEYGEYELQDSIIRLHNNQDKTWELTYREGDKKGQMKFSIFKEDRALKYFSMKRIENSTSSDYPFLLENNEWRMKATSDETTNEIIDRLQNHLQYLEDYIEWCNEEKLKIRFHNLPSPIKVAGNGFRMKNYAATSKWCNIFQEESNCKESFDLLNKYFRSNKFRWSEHKNQSKRLMNGLAQIRLGLEEYRTE